MEKIRAIEADASLTDLEKARRRQELLGGVKEGEETEAKGVLGILGDQFNCSICMQLLDRPVSVRFFGFFISVADLFFFMKDLSFFYGGK